MNNALRTFVEEIFSTSKLNRVPAEMGGGRIFSPPLLGVARGDDPIFDKLKEVVHPKHLTPAEMWNSSGLPEAPDRGARLRVVSIIFPFDGPIRQAGKESREMPPEVYCLARNWANAFQREALQRTVAFFEGKGEVQAPLSEGRRGPSASGPGAGNAYRNKEIRTKNISLAEPTENGEKNT